MGEILKSQQLEDWYNNINSVRSKKNISLGNISVPEVEGKKVLASQINNVIASITSLYSNTYLSFADQSVSMNQVEGNQIIKKSTANSIDERLQFLSKICANYVNNTTQSASSLPSFATTAYIVTSPPNFSTASKSNKTTTFSTCSTWSTFQTSSGDFTETCFTDSTASNKTFTAESTNVTDSTFTAQATFGQCNTDVTTGKLAFSTNWSLPCGAFSTWGTKSTQADTTQSDSTFSTYSFDFTTDKTLNDKTNTNNNSTYTNYVTQSSGYQVKGE